MDNKDDDEKGGGSGGGAGGFTIPDNKVPFGAPFSYNIPPGTAENKESNTSFGGVCIILKMHKYEIQIILIV